jgi:Tfp pilus assembly protein PilN
MSAPRDTALVLGGVPKADLLPPEVREAQRGKALVRKLLAALVGIVLLIVGGYGFATVRSLTASAMLEAEHNRTNELLTEQLTYADARRVDTEIRDAIAAREAGMVTEIDWEAYLREIDATIPTGIELTSITIDSISPAESSLVPEAPLQDESVATLTINATSRTVPDVETWLNRLEALTGFAGVAPPVTVSGTEQAGFLVAIQVQVNDEAYAGRFTSKEDEEESD